MKILAIILFILLHNPNSQVKQQNTFKLNLITNPGVNNSSVYLIYQCNGTKFIDSAIVKDNNVDFTGEIDLPVYATIIVDSKKIGIDQILSKKSRDFIFYKFILHNGEINLKSSKDNKDFITQKSQLNEDYQKFKEMTSSIEEQRDSISNLLYSDLDSVQKPIKLGKLDSIEFEFIKVTIDYIQQNSMSEYSIFCLENYFIYNQNQLRLNKHLNLPKPEKLFNNLALQVRNSIVGKDLEEKISASNNLAVGNLAPTFILPDNKGNKRNLKDFLGKYVLIDFWASWCGPCIHELPKIRNLYTNYRDKNFEIIGISLDDKSTETNWKEIIKKENLNWVQLSDLKHWDSEMVKLYSIYSIPGNILIDENGKIIGKNLTINQIAQILEYRYK